MASNDRKWYLHRLGFFCYYMYQVPWVLMIFVKLVYF